MLIVYLIFGLAWSIFLASRSDCSPGVPWYAPFVLALHGLIWPASLLLYVCDQLSDDEDDPDYDY